MSLQSEGQGVEVTFQLPTHKQLTFRRREKRAEVSESVGGRKERGEMGRGVVMGP